MQFRNKLFYFFFFIIIVFGFFIRTLDLSKLPSGFFCDEASISYNAYSILTTGKDEFAKPFPVLFQSFGNFRPGTSIYFSVPFIAAFGMNEFSARLPSAIIGTLGILFIFFLAQLLYESPIISLFSAFFLTISPWEIHFSRIGQENIYLPIFLSLSLVLFLFGIKKKNAVSLIASFIAFGITLYTYVVAYFIVPLFILLLTILYAKDLWRNKRYLFIGIAIFLFMSIPLISGFNSGETMARFNDASSVNQQKTLQQFAQKAFITYRDHFSYDFLFRTGDIGYATHFITRFSVKGFGELYAIQFPLIIIGIIALFVLGMLKNTTYSAWRYIKHHDFKKMFKVKKETLLLFGWIILYPLGSTAVPFTDGGGPFATRSIIGVLPFQILTAIGIFFLLSLFKNKVYKFILILTILLTTLISFSSYLEAYTTQYPLYSSDFWGWQFGAKDVIKYFVDNEKKYDELFMAPEFNAPDIFLKYYSPHNCSKCEIGLPEDKYNPSLRQLFAVTPNYINLFTSAHHNLGFKNIENVYYPNETIAFEIGEMVKR